MVTCYLRYEIDPYQLDAFEEFARRWIDLVIASASASIPSSSRPIASARRRAACVATSAASCARYSPATEPDARA
jgi:hypothetical protein